MQSFSVISLMAMQLKYCLVKGRFTKLQVSVHKINIVPTIKCELFTFRINFQIFVSTFSLLCTNQCIKQKRYFPCNCWEFAKTGSSNSLQKNLLGCLKPVGVSLDVKTFTALFPCSIGHPLGYFHFPGTGSRDHMISIELEVH